MSALDCFGSMPYLDAQRLFDNVRINKRGDLCELKLFL